MKVFGHCQRFIKAFAEENLIETIGYVFSISCLSILIFLLWGRITMLPPSLALVVLLKCAYDDVKSFYSIYGKNL